MQQHLGTALDEECIIACKTESQHTLFVFSVDWIKNKLRQLRNSFTKAKKAPSSGSARKASTKRTVWLLEKLQFLEPYIATRQTVSNLNAVSIKVFNAFQFEQYMYVYSLLNVMICGHV